MGVLRGVEKTILNFIINSSADHSSRDLECQTEMEIVFLNQSVIDRKKSFNSSVRRFPSLYTAA